ncbi:MAG TPA: hypothetical protein VIY48_20870 [Candidatus Paceibacterota bacterium]
MASIDDSFLTIREVVLEIRSDVKDLSAKIDRIDREGSIGTKQELADHEVRLREQEKFRFAFPSVAVLSFLTSVAGIALVFIYG